MKTKAYALVSTIAFAMSSPVFAAAVTVGAGAATSAIPSQPRYDETIVTNEKISVRSAPKTINFAVHSKTADTTGFVINFPVAGETATVTTSAFDQSGNPLGSAICIATPAKCTFPSGTRKATITISSSDGTLRHKTYSTTYYQACDNSATRFCGTERTYGTFSGTFTNATEISVGGSPTMYQGDIDIFNSNSGNTPLAGDVVKLHVFSDKVIASTNIPSLRIKAFDTAAGKEVLVGHRFPCKATVGGVTGKEWDCAIGFDGNTDAVPNLAGYTNPRIVFSSTRNASLGTITITNAIKNTSVLACTPIP